MRLGVGKGEERERGGARALHSHMGYMSERNLRLRVYVRAHRRLMGIIVVKAIGGERERGCSCERFADSEKMPPREKLMVACSLSAREKSGVFCW